MEIAIRRCPQCRAAYLDDVDLCPQCQGLVTTVPDEAPGTGKIYSYTRVHVAPEHFRDIVPYYLGIIQLDAGPRLMARLETSEGDAVRIDAPVEAVSKSDSGYVFGLK